MMNKQITTLIFFFFLSISLSFGQKKANNNTDLYQSNEKTTSATIGVVGHEVYQGCDLDGSDNKMGYVIIGEETGANLAFDGNEIQSKNTNNPAGTLFLNSRAGNVVVADNGNNTSGKLLVGTLTGASKLTVSVEGSNGVEVEGNGTGDVGYILRNGGGVHFLIDDESDNNSLNIQSANELKFSTNGANEAMRIRDDGDVYIGHNIVGGTQPQISVYTDDNNEAMYVLNDKSGTAGTAGITSICNADGSGNRTGIYGIANGTSTAPLMIGVEGLGNSTTADNAYGVYGNVIGTSTGINRYGVYGNAPINTGESWAVYANGDMHHTGTLTSGSDRRLKRNIEEASSSMLAKVMQLQVKTYEYDTEKFEHINLSTGKKIGFIAQELQEIFPEIVHKQQHSFAMTNPDNIHDKKVVNEELLGVDYISIIPILTKALQEQQKQIEAMKQEIEALKK